MFVRTVIGKNDVLAELLEIFVAAPAIPAGVDHAADRSQIAFFEFFHVPSDRDHTTDNLMAGHARIRGGAAPFITRGVNVRVANAAEQNVDLDIVRQRIAAREREWCERRFRRLSRVGFRIRSHLIGLTAAAHNCAPLSFC